MQRYVKRAALGREEFKFGYAAGLELERCKQGRYQKCKTTALKVLEEEQWPVLQSIAWTFEFSNDAM